jgi:hypothetical protein
VSVRIVVIFAIEEKNVLVKKLLSFSLFYTASAAADENDNDLDLTVDSVQASKPANNFE